MPESYTTTRVVGYMNQYRFPIFPISARFVLHSTADQYRVCKWFRSRASSRPSVHTSILLSE